MNCKYCYASANHANYDMSFDTAKKVIDKLKDYPLKIQFAGGEPLLNFALAEKICQYVRQNNIDAVFQMQTNGTLLDEDIAQKLSEYSISTGVSLDGIPPINNLTRGKTAQAVNGIRMLAEQGMVIGLNAVVTSLNVEALPKLVDFAFYLGNVGGIGLDLLRHAGHGLENCQQLSVTPIQLKQALQKMYRRSQELYHLSGRKVQIREIELAKRRLSAVNNSHDYCYASCGRSIVVLPDGKMYPCGSLLRDCYYMGCADDFHTDSLIHLNAASPLSCSQCEFEAYCPRGCPSRRICNENSLDCVLLKTSFLLAKSELSERKYNENDNQYHSNLPGYGSFC